MSMRKKGFASIASFRTPIDPPSRPYTPNPDATLCRVDVPPDSEDVRVEYTRTHGFPLVGIPPSARIDRVFVDGVEHEVRKVHDEATGNEWVEAVPKTPLTHKP